MLCKQVPKDKTKYYVTSNMDIVYKLIEDDIHPLYHYGTMFYFVRTEKFEKYMSTTDVNL